MSTVIKSASTATFALLLASCGAPREMHVECDGPDCSNPEVTTPGYCTQDTDCQADETCSGGTCTAQDAGAQACNSNDDCPVGLMCRVASGACVECLSDDHCPGLEVCRADGTCGSMETPAGCSSDADCSNGLVCNVATGQCVAASVPDDPGGDPGTDPGDDPPASTTCEQECADLAYTACTCSAADPCGWINDGVCDDDCAQVTATPFDDTADCSAAGTEPPTSCGESCAQLVYDACTCSASDPCGWVGDGVCDYACAQVNATPFDDTADCGGSESCGLSCLVVMYDECTCSRYDPCGWAGDGFCDVACAEVTATPFDDAADCN